MRCSQTATSETCQMSSSELSNALNPHIIQTRSRTVNNSYSSSLLPVVQPPQQHVPHRSELELAISEPPQAPPPPRENNVRPRDATANPQAMQELLRMLKATKESQEIERKRRLAWEQEQEAKYTQRQAEMERQMLEMRQEIVTLKAAIGLHPDMPANDRRQPAVVNLPIAVQGSNPQVLLQQPTPQTSQSPVSTSSQPFSQPIFVQGSSSRPYSQPSTTAARPSSPEVMVVEPPSPQFITVEGSQLHPDAPNPRKRPTPDPDSDEDDESSASEDDEQPTRRPIKRASGHDKRCLTIQHAVRAHLLRVMQLETDKALPDSHIEGTPLASNEPIRFVWDKTPKQSVHNGRMKARFLADIKANRRLYKHVAEKDFNKKSLDAAFDQAFVTLRQKFRAQRDASAALALKRREETKALKARHLSRKKNKLSTRSDTRNRIEAFEHITFDGALQMECMSSEESASEDDDDDDGSINRSSTVYRIRGFPWRSARLRNFYTTLDEGEQADKVFRPRRGVGRKARRLGPPKDGFFMPPKGVASWMISRRWLNGLQMTNPELMGLLSDLVEDPPGFDWSQFLALGGEDSEDEVVGDGGNAPGFDEIHSMGHGLDFTHHYIPHSDNTISTSSLHNALAPV